MTGQKPPKNDVLIAWFGALCFFLSTIEYMIPKPLPFLRLGIANLPVMLAIGVLPLPAYCILVFVKIIGQGLIGGTLFSYIFLFSAAGSLSSALAMLLLKKAFKNRISWIGTSVAGAFMSNVAQLTLARYWIFGESAWYIAPPFIAVGVASGTLLGAFANHYSKKSKWYADVVGGTVDFTETRDRTPDGRNAPVKSPMAGKTFRFPVGVALILACMFVGNVWIQAGIIVLSVILVIADRSKIRIFPIVTMSGSIILFNLFAPFGKVIASPFGLPLTEGALLLGIKKALTVEGMVFISRWMLKPGLRLPGKPGMLVTRAFDILGLLSSGRKKIDPKNLVASIDSIMYGRD